MNLRFFFGFLFSFLYFIGVFLRNKLYDLGIFKENSFKVPVIGVGNLTFGGSGKTPHIEYLVRLLKSKRVIATLSRGYGRKTNGFLYASENSIAREVGDEPLQLKYKFSNALVAVCESRKKGIEKIMSDHPDVAAILLDDAFQHRAVKPGISILLIKYSGIFKPYFLLPAGDLREPFSAKKRADIIIVSKSPLSLSESEREKVIKRIDPAGEQPVFFSSLVYNKILQSVFGSDQLFPDRDTHVLLVTGIADAHLVKVYCSSRMSLRKHLEFSDHHKFSQADIKNIIKIFSTITATKKIILTTEKDAMRLKQEEALMQLPVYYLPVEVQFHEKDKEQFNKLILDHVGKN